MRVAGSYRRGCDMILGTIKEIMAFDLTGGFRPVRLMAEFVDYL